MIGYQRAFITGRDGVGVTDIGGSAGNDINAAGQVTGTGTGSNLMDGFITGPNGVGMTILGKLGTFFTDPAAINDSGQVVGGSATTQVIDGHGLTHAFLTGNNGMGMTDLGTLGGHDSSAWGINNAGQVVGLSDMPDGSSHAFITGPNGGGMTDLNTLASLPGGVVLVGAGAINNTSEVIALAIPEPASYAWMLVGLGVVGFMTRRRKAGGAEVAQPHLMI